MASFIASHFFSVCRFSIPYHLITLSALASTLGGMVRPICLAALRLINSPNFVGCSTGGPAGFWLTVREAASRLSDEKTKPGLSNLAIMFFTARNSYCFLLPDARCLLIT